ncbi:hypothetical protein ACFY9N_16190 [Microbacterium sp. NPDC008134]|uniref:hypothetical protein n=1 Tax=Microbacterium sp. NPDC008134 TaxID=3364183 RepID=UPI0036EB685E
MAIRKLAAGAAVLGFVLTGCAAEQGNDMNSTKGLEQLDVAVEAVQSATGTEWDQVTEIGPIGCSPGLEQIAVSWKGVATADRDVAYAEVREALEEVGFSTHMIAASSKTPSVGSQTGDGFGLAFSYPIEDGPIYLSVGSDCFPLEEWPPRPVDSGP